MRHIGSPLAVVVLTLFAPAAPAAAHQVPFTATGTAVITGVTRCAARPSRPCGVLMAFDDVQPATTPPAMRARFMR